MTQTPAQPLRQEAPVVTLDHVRLSYQSAEGETPALSDISFSVRPGEFVALVGPSGCGKSTLLSLIAGLIQPQQGTVTVLGEPVTRPDGRVGYMLQRDHLFDWRTIKQNAYLGLEISHQKTPERVARVSRLLAQYGLKDFADHYPRQLSGGMRQRAALIRTLALDPQVLLLDEPFSALDSQTRLAVSEDIGRILRQEGRTAILVTHDISEAISMADRVLVLSKRPAIIKKSFEISLTCPKGRTPLSSRNAPEFREYFDAIWKELDVHVC